MTDLRFQTEAVPRYPQPPFVEMTCPWRKEWSNSCVFSFFYFFRFSVVLRPQNPSGLLGTGQDCHLDFYTAPGLWLQSVQFYFTSIETVRTIRDKEPMATSTFTQLLSSDQIRFLEPVCLAVQPGFLRSVSCCIFCLEILLHIRSFKTKKTVRLNI